MGFFYHRFTSESLNKLYELLAEVTPLAYDCGSLCGAACCKGTDRDGMILFPGERELFDALPGFSIRPDDKYGYDELVCGGVCDREVRPLSCRIYPYFFYVADGAVRVAPDVRALRRCPLADSKTALDRTFLRRMRMCAEVIRSDDTLYDFVARLSAMLTDFGRLA